MISTGLNEKSFAEMHFAGDRFSELTTEMLGGPLDTFMKDKPIRVFCYTKSETEIQPGTTYTINSMFIDRLHAE